MSKLIATICSATAIYLTCYFLVWQEQMKKEKQQKRKHSVNRKK